MTSMKSFARELSEKEFGSVGKTVSRHIIGYKTCKGKVRYHVNVQGLYGGTFSSFEEAVEKRTEMLNFLKEEV